MNVFNRMKKMPCLLAAYFLFPFTVMGAGGILSGDGTASKPFIIQDFADFDVYCNSPSSWDDHTRLDSDLDLSNRTYSRAPIAPETANNVGPFTFTGTQFTGTFDGNGHTISNLVVVSNGTNSSFLGLFGYVGQSTAVIKNLIIVSVRITGDTDSDMVGGLCGRSAGIIDSCRVEGAVSSGSEGQFLGGLCGFNSGIIRRSVANVNVSGGVRSNSYSGTGGFCGRTDGLIENSVSSGDVTGQEVGGFCGVVFNAKITRCSSRGAVLATNSAGGFCNNNSGSILKCFSLGSVRNTGISGIQMGGFVAITGGDIKDCYSAGDLVGALGNIAGGFAGEIRSTNVVNCYSIGKLQFESTSNVGGFCGYKVSAEELKGCFWDKDTSGIATSNGGTGKITAEMKTRATFLAAGWDFTGESTNGTEDVWGMDAYPILYMGYASIDRTSQGFIAAFSGVLQESPDLSVWHDIVPQPTSPWIIVPTETRKFYRAKQ